MDGFWLRRVGFQSQRLVCLLVRLFYDGRLRSRHNFYFRDQTYHERFCLLSDLFLLHVAVAWITQRVDCIF